MEKSNKTGFDRDNLDYDSMTNQDIIDLFPELKITDVSGQNEGEISIFFSNKPGLNSKDSEDNIQRDTDRGRGAEG